MAVTLDKIVRHKQNELNYIKRQVDRSRLVEFAHEVTPANFAKTLSNDRLDLIGEVKPRSPSAGALTEMPCTKIGEAYQEHEAVSAVSVLTDSTYFGMTVDDFRAVRDVVQKPILRKEFIIDPFQVLRSAALGADAILLIASILKPNQLESLYERARDYGLDCLVEIHSHEEYKRLPFSPDIVGINNRKLEDDFSTDISRTRNVAPKLPDSTTIVSESGITNQHDRQTINEVSAVNAALIGTAFVRSSSSKTEIKKKIQNLTP